MSLVTRPRTVTPKSMSRLLATFVPPSKPYPQAGRTTKPGRLARLRPPHHQEYRAQARAVRQRPTPTQARSRLVKGEDGPSDSALAAARGGRLRRPAADRHAARCASRALCSGVRPLALYAL